MRYLIMSTSWLNRARLSCHCDLVVSDESVAISGECWCLVLVNCGEEEKKVLVKGIKMSKKEDSGEQEKLF